MKTLLLVAAFILTLAPSFALAQWTYTPGYQVGTPDWTFDAVFQSSRHESLSGQNMTQQNRSAPGQMQRIDPRTVRRIDNHEDITGYGRLNIVERPVAGY